MSATERDLALRKEILLTRSALLRLKLRHDTLALRRSLGWREVSAAVVHSPPARDAIFLAAAEAMGRDRTARWLAQAMGILGIAKVTLSLLHSLRERQPETAPPQQQRPQQPQQPREPV